MAKKDDSKVYRVERLVGEDTWETIIHKGHPWDDLTPDQADMAMQICTNEYRGVPFRVVGPQGVVAWLDQESGSVMVTDRRTW